MITGDLEVKVDDKADIYADGVFLGWISNPFIISTVMLPDDTNLLGVRAENFRGIYGFIMKLSNGFVTGTHWKCSNTEHDNWYKLSYNDDDWQPARITMWPPEWSPLGLDPAEFIWAEKYTDVVYCRGWPSKYYNSKIYTFTFFLNT